MVFWHLLPRMECPWSVGQPSRRALLDACCIPSQIQPHLPLGPEPLLHLSLCDSEIPKYLRCGHVTHPGRRIFLSGKKMAPSKL